MDSPTDDLLKIEWSDDGNKGYEPGHYAVAYECEQLLKYNKAASVKIEYYYDLLRKKDDDEKEIVQRAENALLESVASHFGLKEGSRCSVPPIDVMWLVRISSWPRDSIVKAFDSCLNLQPGSDQICDVYKGTMTGFALGDVDETDMIQYIQQEMQKDERNASDEYIMSFLGTQIDTTIVSSRGRDKLTPSMNFVDRMITFRGDEKREVTWIGGLLFTGFALLVLGVIFVLYRRRRRWMMAEEAEVALSKSIDDYESPPSKYSNVVIQPIEIDTMSNGESSDSEYISPSANRGGYLFDLGSNMRNDMFGIHNKGGPTRDPFGHNMNGMEELASESDADSWAQTEATIGTLEHQLEPITAEV